MELGIYNARMLRLAAEATGAGRLSEPDGSAEIVNPTCGDRITVDVRSRTGASPRSATRCMPAC